MCIRDSARRPPAPSSPGRSSFAAGVPGWAPIASRATGAALGCAPRRRADSAPGSESSDGVGA
eukprot:3087264-Alexandrium_andersonii.AAC.1